MQACPTTTTCISGGSDGSDGASSTAAFARCHSSGPTLKRFDASADFARHVDLFIHERTYRVVKAGEGEE